MLRYKFVHRKSSILSRYCIFFFFLRIITFSLIFCCSLYFYFIIFSIRHSSIKKFQIQSYLMPYLLLIFMIGFYYLYTYSEGFIVLNFSFFVLLHQTLKVFYFQRCILKLLKINLLSQLDNLLRLN